MTHRPSCQHLIWDWNGTLLDDAHHCVAVLNELCVQRGMAPLSVQHYRRTFAFPVVHFYEQIGFDFAAESFGDIAEQYHARYLARLPDCRLHHGAAETLLACQNAGLTQSILSAYHQQKLESAVEHFQLGRFFLQLKGLDDIHAHSKVDAGRQLLTELPYPPERILFIGDTVHDFEVATALGLSCVLLTCGHNDRRQLAPCNVDLFETLAQLANHILHL